MEKQRSETRRPQHHNDPDTNRKNQDHEFPGYPHYPAREDVLDAHNDYEKTDTDVENFSRNTWNTARNEALEATAETPLPPDTAYDDREDVLPPTDAAAIPPSDLDEDIELTGEVIDPEAEVTEEDLHLLGDPDQDMDGGDDELLENYQGLDDTDFDGEPLNEYTGTLAATGRDLDLPDHTDLDGAGTAMEPEEDEENDYYSLGADKDTLEDDQAGDNF